MERQSRKNSTERGPLAKFTRWTILAAVLSTLSADTLTSTRQPDGGKKTGIESSNTPKLTEKERLALHKLQCRVVDAETKKTERFVIHQERGRAYHLNNFAKLLSCAEFNADYDPSVVCIAVKNEIENHPVEWILKNRIMRPFFENLYLELKCQDVENPASQAPVAVKELFALLKVQIEKDPPKALDPKTSIKELCRPAFALVEKHESDINSIANYILEHRQLPPKLAQRIELWRKNYQKKHKTKDLPSRQDLRASVEKNVGRAVIAAATAPLTCKLPEGVMLWAIDKDMTAQKLTQYRTEMFPLVREFVEMLAKDTEENKPGSDIAFEALQRIAQSITRIE